MKLENYPKSRFRMILGLSRVFRTRFQDYLRFSEVDVTVIQGFQGFQKSILGLSRVFRSRFQGYQKSSKFDRNQSSNVNFKAILDVFDQKNSKILIVLIQQIRVPPIGSSVSRIGRKWRIRYKCSNPHKKRNALKNNTKQDVREQISIRLIVK